MTTLLEIFNTGTEMPPEDDRCHSLHEVRERYDRLMLRIRSGNPTRKNEMHGSECGNPMAPDEKHVVPPQYCTATLIEIA